jgi:hypothetical protein
MKQTQDENIRALCMVHTRDPCSQSVEELRLSLVRTTL